MAMLRLAALLLAIDAARSQLNLGSLNLGKDQNGNLQLGFGQGGSIFGFGGDRSLQTSIGPQGFGLNSGGGLTLNGERLGINSIFGVDQARGLNLGSFLHNTNSGNQPAPPTVARAAAPTDDGRGLGSVLETFMRMITPTPPPFEGETRGGAINSPWPTPPEPPLEELPTFAPSFATHPTLLPNAWSARASHGSSFDGENQASGGGGWVNGVESSSVAAVDLRSSATNSPPPPPPPSSVSSERPPAINSGEAASSAFAERQPNNKKRVGPPPPNGMIEIDAVDRKHSRS